MSKALSIEQFLATLNIIDYDDYLEDVPDTLFDTISKDVEPNKMSDFMDTEEKEVDENYECWREEEDDEIDEGYECEDNLKDINLYNELYQRSLKENVSFVTLIRNEFFQHGQKLIVTRGQQNGIYLSCHLEYRERGGKGIKRSLKQETQCPMKVELNIGIDGKVTFKPSCCWRHNHNTEFVKPILTKEQKEMIQEQIKKGHTSRQIALDMDFFVLVSEIENIKKTFRRGYKKNMYQLVVNELKNLTNFDSHFVVDETNKFLGLIAINRFALEHISFDVVFVDDTTHTNDLDLDEIVMIGIDPDGRNVIIAIAFSLNTKTESFTMLFTHLKELMITHQKRIEYVVCDRDFAQTNALKVFEDCHIVYCIRHIARNIKSRFGQNSDLYKLFNKMCFIRDSKQSNATAYIPSFKSNQYSDSENEYLNVIDEMIKREDDDGKRALNLLKTQIDSYLPSILVNFPLMNNRTTNRVEGFFGIQKRNMYNVYFPMCIKNIKLLNDLYLAKPRNKTSIPFDGLLSDKSRKQLGSLAINYLVKEMEAIKNGCVFPIKECCCSSWLQWRIPCRHMIMYLLKENKSLPIIKDEMIPSKYFWYYSKPCKQGIVSPTIQNTSQESTPSIDDFTSAVNFLLRFEEGRNYIINGVKIFQKSEVVNPQCDHVRFLKLPHKNTCKRVSQTCDNHGRSNSTNMYVVSPTIHPGEVVIRTGQRKKRTICCRICGGKHYQKTCPHLK